MASLITSFYTDSELKGLGFKSLGADVKISRFARFYSPQTISIGDNVRIDDFCILSGNIRIGSNIHLSAYVALYGALGIEIQDYSGISPKTVVYSAMDDFSGDYLIGPIHPEETTNVTGGLVRIEKYVQIGSNSVVFPSLTIGEGSVIGACSLVRKSVGNWGVYCGIPAKKIKDRSKKMLNFLSGFEPKNIK
jgi:galactoside O-acetyltransferase